uniref:NADH dehydrogenase subunit 4L n=1 Tax=Bahadzia jaraguensis TaxID=1041811 RepID=K7ZU02_BAHJA|nr:NADH dehydrogenase subunit 4L [Bahadzia jaraguensis]
MEISVMWVVSLGVAMGVMKFVMNMSHLLVSLLSLEFIMLNMYWMMTMSFSELGESMFYVLYFLVLVVCESVLGLSILILMSYGYGVDFLKVFNVLMC